MVFLDEGRGDPIVKGDITSYEHVNVYFKILKHDDCLKGSNSNKRKNLNEVGSGNNHLF